MRAPIDRLCPAQQFACNVVPGLHVQASWRMAVVMDRRQVDWSSLRSYRFPCASDSVVAAFAALPVSTTTTLWICEVFFALGHVVLTSFMRSYAPVYSLDLLVMAWLVLLEIPAPSNKSLGEKQSHLTNLNAKKTSSQETDSSEQVHTKLLVVNQRLILPWYLIT